MGGFVTPAFAFRGTNFRARLEAEKFAGRLEGAQCKWDLSDGKVSEENYVQEMMKMGQRNQSFGEAMQAGWIAAWAPPVMMECERVNWSCQTNREAIERLSDDHFDFTKYVPVRSSSSRRRTVSTYHSHITLALWQG